MNTQVQSRREIVGRSETGSDIAELPVAIFVFLLVALFPLLDLGTLWMGSSSLHLAARHAAVEAGRQPTYSKAVTKARAMAAVAATGGVHIDKTDVTAWQVPYDPTGTPTRVTGAGTPTCDFNRITNGCQLEVTVTGTVAPLVTLSGLSGILGNVPGLTGPLTVVASSMSTYENTDGLNK